MTDRPTPTTGSTATEPLESLLLAVEEVGNAWYDDEGTVRWYDEFFDRIVTLRRAYNAYEESEAAASPSVTEPETSGEREGIDALERERGLLEAMVTWPKGANGPIAIAAYEALVRRLLASLPTDHNHDGGAHCFSDCPAYTRQVHYASLPTEPEADR